MKTLCVWSISNRHKLRNLKNRKNCTSAVAQVKVHNVPSAHKVPNQHIIYLLALAGTPSLYGAGYAKSDFTTCLPAPQRCWGPLGRSEQAVFWGPDFGESAQTWPYGSTYWGLLHIFYCFATQLRFRCSSIIADLSNAEWLKYHWSNLYWVVLQPRPWQNSPCTCRLPRHPQDVEYKRSTSGALPLATTLKCEFVAQTMSLSSCEPLVGTARQEAASGEPSSCRHNNELIASRPSVPCFCNEWLLSNSSAPAGCRRAGQAQAGTKQLHPTYYEHNWGLMENVWW